VTRLLYALGPEEILSATLRVTHCDCIPMHAGEPLHE
jgi:hypothetical protein